MAWSYGNKRWTSAFKSLNNTSCRIDIYERGYNGQFVQTVNAAADPFFYEEEEDSDLLNTVLRYQTGYIRLVEEYESGSTLSMTDIYPQAALDRWVEVYYGSTLIFNGYIQVQDFSNELVPVPKVIELPVISPLGLMEKQTVSNTAYMPPSEKTLGELLDGILQNTNYERVYVPQYYGQTVQYGAVGLWLTISTLIVSPWNDDYHHSENTGAMQKVMKGKTYAFLIEAICKAFGWICHETPTALVFTAFDYNGAYCYYPVGHIGDNEYRTDADLPVTAEDLTDYYEPADSTPVENTILPDTGIEIEYEGDELTRTFSFDRTYVPVDGVITTEDYQGGEVFALCNLYPVPQTGEFSLDFSTFAFDGDRLTTGHGCCAWNGMEGVMVSLANQSMNHNLFRLRFYIKKRPNQSYGFSYDFRGRRDGTIGGLAANPDVADYYVTYTLDATHDDYINVTFRYRFDVSAYPELWQQSLLFIHNIKLIIYEDNEPYTEYRYKPTDARDVIPADGTPAISNSVEMPISLYRLNDHLIGTIVRQTKVTEYPYLFQPRRELRARFKVVALADFYHARLFNYNNKNWRIIAQRFDPWNDEMTLTMQNCELLDSSNE